MYGTIFQKLGLQRAGDNQWERLIYELTPVHAAGPMRYKREDWFAPLGYGGINGAKLRQLIWLVHGATGASELISAASVKSPQISMGAAVAAHYGMGSTFVLGATTPASAPRHENVAIAAAIGARFEYEKVAYNPALQRGLKRLHAARPGAFLLEYGISVSGSDAAIEAFHRVGSEQARNIPSDVETLLLPAGSCNSCVSILYGLARFRPAALREVVLFGIGPNRLAFIDERLAAIERVSGVTIRALFHRNFVHQPKVAAAQNAGTFAPQWLLTHHDLHTTKFASYQDEMPYSGGGIEFHPTYEGKVWRYIEAHDRVFGEVVRSGKALFWIVGSKPTMAAMRWAL